MRHISPYKIHYDELLRKIDISLDKNSLSDSFRNYILACKVEDKAKATLETYIDRIGRFLKFLEENGFASSPDGVTNQHCRYFILWLKEKGLQPATIDSFYRAIHSYLRWMIAEGIMQKDPMQNVKPPRVPKKVIKPLTDNEINDMLTICSGNRFVDVRNKAIISIFLDTGIRLKEMASIIRDDINFDKETIKIHGKCSKERYVRIGKTVQKALLRYILLRNDNYSVLWLNECRKPITREGIDDAVDHVMIRAGVKEKGRGAHCLRHTAAIRFLRNGGDPFTLQIMLGHSTLQMTRRYVSTLGADDLIEKHKTASPMDNLK